ncbi:uncharacterized protein AB675_8865 [Cyphellophora attinorum]|uniref:Uncharacterized protein n=1 Tax=Cyphellophora attinorum TaxID=1664694 RepID=A0A0N1H4J8_9EURO|nr:uncharacterized protein AB675_8865 [Phialophora attinorum]KPI36234.1 hypothetical protein AB675_8865 [Phialophora attinorum]
MDILQRPLPNAPRFLAIALGAVITHAGVSAFVTPTTFTAQFGLPQQPPINPWVYAFAAREVTLGLTLCAFAARKDWKSVGVVGVIAALCGATDGKVEHICEKPRGEGFLQR